MMSSRPGMMLLTSSNLPLACVSLLSGAVQKVKLCKSCVVRLPFPANLLSESPPRTLLIASRGSFVLSGAVSPPPSSGGDTAQYKRAICTKSRIYGFSHAWSMICESKAARIEANEIESCISRFQFFACLKCNFHFHVRGPPQKKSVIGCRGSKARAAALVLCQHIDVPFQYPRPAQSFKFHFRPVMK